MKGNAFVWHVDAALLMPCIFQMVKSIKVYCV